MAEQRKVMSNKQTGVSKIDALYSWLSYDLQKAKKDLLEEMKYSSVQMGSLYGEMKGEGEKNSKAIAQEIRYGYIQNQNIYDGLSTAIAETVSKIEDVIGRLDAFASDELAEGVKEKVAGVLPPIEETLNEIKYSYLQHQSIYENLKTVINDGVITKMDEVYARFSLIEQMDVALEEMRQKLYELADTLTYADHQKLVEDVAAAVPVAENVDYVRIADEVGDKVLELLGDVLVNQPEKEATAAVEAKVDYEKIIYGTTEKIIESLPYPEKVDYRRIDDMLAAAVEKAVAALDYDVLAQKVAEKVQIPAPAPCEIDYDKLADLVAAKVAANTADEMTEEETTYDFVIDDEGIDELSKKVAEKIQIPEATPCEIDYDKIVDMVVEKLAANAAEETTEEETSLDFVISDEGIEALAQKVAEMVQIPEAAPCEIDYEKIVDMVVAKLTEDVAEQPEEEMTYNFVFDDEGVDAMAARLAERLCTMCAACEETVEEPVVEETVEEPVEEAVEEAPVVEEEVVEEVVETPVVEEIAVAKEQTYEEIGGELVDAETGMVIRLKRSFTAKMSQSEDDVKQYYSDLKNALLAYKKIRSNVSWHGDRFNYGRETVAKMGINGKTLCFYLALDPNDEEQFKPTVYHQKNVGDQKAHESTPFMVKVKSGAAVKKALRLVAALVEKIGAEKMDTVETVEYAAEFPYASTKQLLNDGHIKLTKEKKVEFNF
ncbi:MAG: hypothetical protein E7355_04550 [Clostridiales bacterium]|nr:hypothetical protein [Clostridiales bacterium]